MAAIQSYFSQSFEIVEYIYHFEYKLGLGVDSRMSYKHIYKPRFAFSKGMEHFSIRKFLNHCYRCNYSLRTNEWGTDTKLRMISPHHPASLDFRKLYNPKSKPYFWVRNTSPSLGKTLLKDFQGFFLRFLSPSCFCTPKCRDKYIATWAEIRSNDSGQNSHLKANETKKSTNTSLKTNSWI